MHIDEDLRGECLSPNSTNNLKTETILVWQHQNQKANTHYRDTLFLAFVVTYFR